MFGKNKLVVAPVEEKALFLEALQGEIAHTLENVTGVVTARVHVALPEQDLSGQNPKPPKGSVMLEYHADAAGEAPIRAEDVARLVASRRQRPLGGQRERGDEAHRARAFAAGLRFRGLRAGRGVHGLRGAS